MQFLHRPFLAKKLKIGISSNQRNVLKQLGQIERPPKFDHAPPLAPPYGGVKRGESQRRPTTLRKLPTIVPKTKRMTVVVILSVYPYTYIQRTIGVRVYQT